MKNVQVIDGANNTEYAIYQITDEQFSFIFPLKGQDIEFIEDVIEKHGIEKVNAMFEFIWERKIPKHLVHGIHGTLFYELTNKKKYYPGKKEKNLVGVAGTVADIKYSKYKEESNI